MMQKTAKEHGHVRIVNLISAGHMWPAKGRICLEQCKPDMRSTSAFARYGQSKSANIFFTKGLAKHYPDIKSVAIRPGGVDTSLQRGPTATWPWVTTPMMVLSDMFMITAADGALTELFAATSKDANNGTHYVPTAKKNSGSGYARDEKLMEALWDWNGRRKR